MTENTSSRRFWTLENTVIIILIALTFLSRYYDLGARVMSHDEVNHVVPSYSLYQGNGYSYDPVTHGPLQFHLIALSYYLFGDSDFASRAPHALFSVFTVAFALIFYRRYLGKIGAFAAGIFLLISPYMLFYGRYARNEAFIVVWALLVIYAILRYLESGDTFSIFLFTAANALHFTDKATSYIFAGLELIFLSAYLVLRITRSRWPSEKHFRTFLLGLMLALIGLGGAAGLFITQKGPAADTASVETATPAAASTLSAIPAPMLALIAVLALGGLAALVYAVIALLRGFGLPALRRERPFDLVILLGTLILPLGAALPIKLIGFNPLEYQDSSAYTRDGIAILLLSIIAIVIGLWWNRRTWLLHAGLFYIPFVLLYSTFFTNGQGLGVGFMGALGYWMEQQGVQRGGQPLYYYALLQIPVYEFLPAFGALLAVVIGIARKLWVAAPGEPFTPAPPPAKPAEVTEEVFIPSMTENTPADEVLDSLWIQAPTKEPVPTLALLIFWSVMTLAAFTVAGERMPWLTIHISLPLCLSAGWALGWLVETVAWPSLSQWKWRNYAHAALLGIFAILAFFTMRSSYRASFINYDYANEYLVYAHAARDPKTILQKIEEISIQTTGTPTDIVVAYDNNMRYPYWWYMRRFPNRIDFDKTPTNTIRNADVILVSPENIGKVQPIVRDNYYSSEYMRLWWPNQDYWNLKWDAIQSEYQNEYMQVTGTQEAPDLTYPEYFRRIWLHIKPFFSDPAVRHAIWEIWYNRDFSEYAALKGSDAFTLTTWSPADKVTMFIRKDLANSIWDYGIQPVDPYEGITITLTPDVTYGGTGSANGQFMSPHAIATAPDGSLYIADSRNNRIQHLSADGSVVLNVWGAYGNAAENAPGGTFNEPWGVAVASDGTVFVADTWNHRIQKFTPEGKFIRMWGVSAMGNTPDGFYGPRGLAVDAEDRLYIADTGNNRIVVSDGDGNYLTQFGTLGLQPGQFTEPVAVAVDTNGQVYVTDTWNQRIQVFAPDASGVIFNPVTQWDVYGWDSQSVDNKPFISIADNGHVFVTDPEACQLIEYAPDGQLARAIDPCDPASTELNLPSGLVNDSNGFWLTDAGNNTLMHFTLPE